MKFVRSLSAEILRSIVRAPLQSLLLCAIYACVSAATLLSTGGDLEEVKQLKSRLGGTELGWVEVETLGGDEVISTEMGSRLSSFGTVVRVIATKSVVDCVGATTGALPAGLRVGTIIAGGDEKRLPMIGWAVGSSTDLEPLRLTSSTGVVQCGGKWWPVQRVETRDSSFVSDRLASGLVALVKPSASEMFSALTIVASGYSELDEIREVAELQMQATQTDYRLIDSSDELRTRIAFLDESLSAKRRALSISIMSAALAVSLIRFLTIALRSKDLGRRRALGCSRSQLAIVVAGEGAAVAALGGAIGTALTVYSWLGVPGFAARLSVLVVASSVIAGLPGIYRAVRLDPVRVLRSP